SDDRRFFVPVLVLFVVVVLVVIIVGIGGILLPPMMVTRLRMFSGIRGGISAPVRMSRHSRSMLAGESRSGKASALLSFNVAACSRAALTGDVARTPSLRQA